MSVHQITQVMPVGKMKMPLIFAIVRKSGFLCGGIKVEKSSPSK